jgi:hypothetical protein
VQQIDALNDADAEARVLRREVKQLRKENLDLSVSAGDDEGAVVRELRARVASYELRIQKLQRWTDFEPIIRRIEIALERFPVERPDRLGEDVPDRLEAILNVIFQVRELFDEQRRGGDKRPTFSGSPRGSILRTSPRSPR